MQCKDCLKEIDDKEYYNRSIEGLCKKRRQKMSQIKYENKKFTSFLQIFLLIKFLSSYML